MTRKMSTGCVGRSWTITCACVLLVWRQSSHLRDGQGLEVALAELAAVVVAGGPDHILT